ncbi:MAG: hypothetical protein EZS28_003136, partial [Streblomastix strix]
ATLFCELLNQYLFFSSHGVEAQKQIELCVSLIKPQVEKVEDTMGAAIAAYFANTLQHIDAEKLKGVRTTTKEGEDEGDEEEEEGEGN